jgi:hypothetical protein
MARSTQDPTLSGRPSPSFPPTFTFTPALYPHLDDELDLAPPHLSTVAEESVVREDTVTELSASLTQPPPPPPPVVKGMDTLNLLCFIALIKLMQNSLNLNKKELLAGSANTTWTASVNVLLHYYINCILFLQ